MRTSPFTKKVVISTSAGLAFCSTLAVGEIHGSEDAIGGLEEVVVTARNRAESLEDLPLSISAFTDTTIQSAELTSISEIALMTPNLSFQNTFGRYFDRPTIRGMANILGTPNTGQFVDGIYSQGSVSSQALEVLQRVEVIRGPQAAQFGRGTFAGAINFITMNPRDELQGKVKASYGNYERKQVSGYVTGPLTESVSYLLSGNYYDRDSVWDNVDTNGNRTGDGAGGQSSEGVLTKVKWRVADEFEALLHYSYSKDDDEASANTLLLADADTCAGKDLVGTYYCGQVPAIGDEISLSYDGFPGRKLGLGREKELVGLKLSYNTGDYSLFSSSAYSVEDFYRITDGDFSAYTVLRGSTHQKRPERLDDFQQEIRLNFDNGGKWQWQAGVYYYDSKFQEPEGGVTYLTAGAVDRPETPRYNVENRAIFGSLGLQLTERTTLSFEARYAIDHLESEASSLLTEKFKSFTPRIIYEFQIDDSLMAYTNFAIGNKPGGFNSNIVGGLLSEEEQARLASKIAFDEEESMTYEVGGKYASSNRRLLANVAVFYIDWDQQQLTTQEPFLQLQPDGTETPNILGLIQNVGETEIYGFEFDVTWRPVDSLTFQSGYGYVHARIKSYDDNVNRIITGNADVSGNELPNVPEHTFNVSATYAHDFDNSNSAEFRADYVFESSRYAQVHNLAETGDISKLNFNARYMVEDWEFAIWAKNVTDDDSVTVITRFFDPINFNFQSGAGFVLQAPEPRTYGISISRYF